jgi:predicted  nucleic acid-binding Zn-ribbon protein
LKLSHNQSLVNLPNTIFHQLKAEIEQERTTNQQLSVDLVAAKQEVTRLTNAQQAFQQEITRLTAVVQANKKQQAVEPNLFSGYSRDEAEIDALVKEIDFCIAQLKHNNG